MSLRVERRLTPVSTELSVKVGVVTVTPLLPALIFALPVAGCPGIVGVVVLLSGRSTCPIDLASEMFLVGLRETWWRPIAHHLQLLCVPASATPRRLEKQWLDRCSRSSPTIPDDLPKADALRRCGTALHFLCAPRTTVRVVGKEREGEVEQVR